jgi:hypothetical protein
MQIERSWPEGERATREQMLARIERFPRGVLIGKVNGEPGATLTACPIVYQRDAGNFSNWNDATNSGHFYATPLPETDALYIASGVVKSSLRGALGAGFFSACVRRVVELALEMQLPFVVAGAMLPGLRRFCERHRVIPAAEYAGLMRNGRCIDPLIEMYRKESFFIPDAKHVLSQYYPDPDSLGYAALVVNEVSKGAL